MTYPPVAKTYDRRINFTVGNKEFEEYLDTSQGREN